MKATAFRRSGIAVAFGVLWVSVLLGPGAAWATANEAPVLDPNRTPTLSPVLEDAPAPSGGVGTLVSDLVDFAVPSGGVDNVSDPDPGARCSGSPSSPSTTRISVAITRSTTV